MCIIVNLPFLAAVIGGGLVMGLLGDGDLELPDELDEDDRLLLKIIYIDMLCQSNGGMRRVCLDLVFVEIKF